MSRRTEKFIPLNRKFLQIPDSNTDLDAEAIRLAQMLDREESWAEVLRNRYVVVLGEAGTGKSTEFLFQAESLSSAGTFALFLELADLANDGLVASIAPEDEEKLNEWRNGQSEGVFFLDSLDEAKLRQCTLRKALHRLKRELGNEWLRVRMVISCRVSDWMAEADRETIQAVIPTGLKGSNAFSADY